MKYDLNDTICKIYYKTDSEFEEVRNICLQEDNWLKKNYTKENLIIEEHSGYGVVFKSSTGEPMVMGGVYNGGRYPANVARQFNRLYTFPNFRMKRTEMVEAFRVACLLADELKAVNDYEVYISTMQSRKGRKGVFWQAWLDSINAASKDAWTGGQGYIQTCPWEVQKCYQYFAWQETVEGAFNKWSPKTITHDIWLTLPEGD